MFAVAVQYWRIVDCTDDLAWALFYYAGAASAAGQSYSGAVLVTQDGTWPPPVNARPAVSRLWPCRGVLIACMARVQVHQGMLLMLCLSYRNTRNA